MEEEKNIQLKLVQEIYRLTLLFPKKEPLRYKMRELADEILLKTGQILEGESQGGSKENIASAISQIDILDSFFEIAKMQNWVASSEILNLQREYGRIKDVLQRKKIQFQAVFPAVQNVEPSEKEISSFEGGYLGNKQRQQKIIEILKEKEKTQVWEVKKIFPKITKRTLRRDFEQLLKQGLIERLGERNTTFYRLKESDSLKVIKI